MRVRCVLRYVAYLYLVFVLGSAVPYSGYDLGVRLFLEGMVSLQPEAQQDKEIV